MRIDPVDFYLLEKSKSRPEIFFRKPANILIRSSFLIEELIGGEGQNLKTFVHQLVVQFSQSRIIFGGQCSLGCHVDDEDSFFAPVNGEVYVVAFDICGFEVEERFGTFCVLVVEVVGGLVEETQACNCSHFYQKNM